MIDTFEQLTCNDMFFLWVWEVVGSRNYWRDMEMRL